MFFQTVRTGLMAAAAAAALLVAIPTAADAQSTGSVRFRVASAGFIIGGGGGTGALNFKGKSYPLRVGGLSDGTVGVSSADLVGTASGLRSPQDIVGTYSGAGAGVAVAGGGSAVTLQNSKGVVLRLQRPAGRLSGHSRRRRRRDHDAVDGALKRRWPGHRRTKRRRPSDGYARP